MASSQIFIPKLENILQIHRNLDRIILISLFVVAYHYFSIFALFLLLTEFVTPFIWGKRLPRATEKQLRSLWNLPRRVRLRKSDRDDCQVIAVLGISVLAVTADVIEAPDSTEILHMRSSQPKKCASDRYHMQSACI